MITSWSDKEDEALQGLPLEAQILYLRGLRRWMDYATGMVGVKRGISWQMLAEVLYVEPHQGLSGGTPTHSKVRRLMQWLEKQGLVESQSAGTRLIFRLPLADTDKSVPKKADRKPTGSRQGLADRKPTGSQPSNDAPTQEHAPDKADRKPTGGEPQKADTPPVSGLRSISPSLRSGGDAARSDDPAPSQETGDTNHDADATETEFQEACRATWNAYAEAYLVRYGVQPLRDKKVNSQIRSIVQRLGRNEAPGVAAFFVTHNGAFYVARGHDVGLLLSDAAKLRTEWATNRQITQAAARQADATATNRETHTGALAILKQKGLA